MTRNPKVAEFDGKLAFWCPGCECLHAINVFDRDTRPLWTWSGTTVRPTLTPSVLVREKFICHSLVRHGQIRFLSDSTHELANQTVDLPDIGEYV